MLLGSPSLWGEPFLFFSYGRNMAAMPLQNNYEKEEVKMARVTYLAVQKVMREQGLELSREEATEIRIAINGDLSKCAEVYARMLAEAGAKDAYDEAEAEEKAQTEAEFAADQAEADAHGIDYEEYISNKEAGVYDIESTEAQAAGKEIIANIGDAVKRAILNALRYNERNAEKKEFTNATIADVDSVLCRSDKIGAETRKLAKNMMNTLATLSGTRRSTPIIKSEDYEESSFSFETKVAKNGKIETEKLERILGVSHVETVSGKINAYVKSGDKITCSIIWGKKPGTNEYYDRPMAMVGSKAITYSSGSVKDATTGSYALTLKEIQWNALIDAVVDKLKELGKAPEEVAQ